MTFDELSEGGLDRWSESATRGFSREECGADHSDLMICVTLARAVGPNVRSWQLIKPVW